MAINNDGSYSFYSYTISARMMESLRAYVEERRRVGHFLTAVLENDLKEAVNRADDENGRNLPAYIAYLYNEAPANCYGSKEKVKAWLDEAEK
jgi:hypothetical protein